MSDAIIVGTSVFVSALRSQRGASYLLMQLVGSSKVTIALSGALVFEYEMVAKRLAPEISFATWDEIDDTLDVLCEIGQQHAIHYRWRPTLSDPNDDMLLELAIAAGCNTIVTYNVRDFRAVEYIGIRAITPLEYLREIGALP